MMVGRALSAWFPEKKSHPAQEVVLEAKGIIVPGSRHPASFSAYRGEILGFAGLVGAGRTELMEVIFGVKPALGGSMLLEGKPFLPSRPRDAINQGVYLAPEDRKLHGLPFEPGPVTGAPLLPDLPAWLETRVVDRVTRGDHEVFVCEVVGAGIRRSDFAPLLLAATPWSYGG